MFNPDPKDCPYYLITRASLRMTALLKQRFAEVDVGLVRPAYLGVLWCLWQGDGVKVVELGRCAGLEPSTMTGLLDRMERDGLVRRAPDPDDRRAQRVHLTELGLEIRERAITVVTDTMDLALEGLTDEQVEATKEALRKVLINVNR